MKPTMKLLNTLALMMVNNFKTTRGEVMNEIVVILLGGEHHGKTYRGTAAEIAKSSERIKLHKKTKIGDPPILQIYKKIEEKICLIDQKAITIFNFTGEL